MNKHSVGDTDDEASPDAERSGSADGGLAASPDRVNALLGSRPIALVGMMGAGKTTVGRRLAKRLGRRFVDADQEIEKAAAMTISEIFEVHGEASFRDGERRVIHRLLGDKAIVLATGGGAFVDDDTRANIKRTAVTIWLKADFEVLMARVRRKPTRPLLKQSDPEAVMRRLIDARYPIYAEADIIVQSRNAPHAEVVDQIMAMLGTYLEDAAARAAGGQSHP